MKEEPPSKIYINYYAIFLTSFRFGSAITKGSIQTDGLALDQSSNMDMVSRGGTFYGGPQQDFNFPALSKQNSSNSLTIRNDSTLDGFKWVNHIGKDGVKKEVTEMKVIPVVEEKVEGVIKRKKTELKRRRNTNKVKVTPGARPGEDIREKLA